MHRQFQFWLLLLVFALSLTACQGRFAPISGEAVQVAGGAYRNITAAELKALMQNKDFLLVNVHIPFEGNIPGTDLSIPYDRIAEADNLSLLPTDKNAKIVLYCRSGRMSAIAAETLVQLGYTNVWNLKGGMVGWEQAGYKLDTK